MSRELNETKYVCINEKNWLGNITSKQTNYSYIDLHLAINVRP